MEYKRIGPGEGHEAGRELLAEMYEERFGRPMPEIAATERGKPFFTDGSCHFSVTHTKRHVFCTLSDCPVGIDAEEIDRNIDLRLADKILSPQEKKQYDMANDRRIALLKFWVLKEASAKCTGEGLRGYPNETEFSLDDPRVTEVDGCLVAVIKKDNVGRGLAPSAEKVTAEEN